MVIFIIVARTRTRNQQSSIDLCRDVHLSLSVSWLDFPESVNVFPTSHQCTLFFLLFVCFFFCYIAFIDVGYIGVCKMFQLGAKTGKKNLFGHWDK